MRQTLFWALVAVAVLAACSKKETAPDPVRAVRTTTIVAQSAGGAYEYAGEVRARTESRLIEMQSEDYLARAHRP